MYVCTYHQCSGSPTSQLSEEEILRFVRHTINKSSLDLILITIALTLQVFLCQNRRDLLDTCTISHCELLKLSHILCTRGLLLYCNTSS